MITANSIDIELARLALPKLAGAAFDRAYVDRAVGYHQAVLDAIDGLLIPTPRNVELRKLLTDVRPAIAAPLAHASSLQSAPAAKP